MSLKRVWIPSPNFSSRQGATVRLIVLHTAEGATTFQSLGAFFQQTSVQASSHVGIDDTPGVIGEFVHPPDKAWTEVTYNPVSVSAEMCAFSAWTKDEWLNGHPQMLKNCAAWIAEESQRWHIPIVELTPAQAQNSGRGVCQHKDLGAAGGGHQDCGPGFPIGHVLQMARSLVAKPAQASGEANASVTCHLGRKQGIWEVHGTAGTAKFGPTDEWEEAIVGVNRKTGKWRIRAR